MARKIKLIGHIIRYDGFVDNTYSKEKFKERNLEEDPEKDTLKYYKI